MALVESLRIKRQLDALARELEAKLQMPTGQRRLNKESIRRLLGFTPFERARVRDLEIYVRPLADEKKEVVVIDNDLPVYHTTVTDVGMRKTPFVREMLSIRNIRRILNDKDVVVSRGPDSLRMIYEQAFSRLDFSYTDQEIATIVAEGKDGLERNSIAKAEEILQVFLELLGFGRIMLPFVEHPVTAYARPEIEDAELPGYRDLILLDREEVQLVLIRGSFTVESETDLQRLLTALSERKVDAEGGEVFDTLGRMALRIDPARRTEAVRPIYSRVERQVPEGEVA
jgi:hypothetical protein